MVSSKIVALVTVGPFRLKVFQRSCIFCSFRSLSSSEPMPIPVSQPAIALRGFGSPPPVLFALSNDAPEAKEGITLFLTC